MDLPAGQLATLLSIAEHGTFEAAARALSITPSAVSQRVRALEAAAGQVVVQRTTPCRPTAAGEVLLRLARQHRLLGEEAAAALAESVHPVGLAVAVNADSLATWFREVIGQVATWEGVALRLRVEDQAHSADLLRRGEVLAAITSDPTPVQGCRVTPLGSMRYRPAASPSYAERWRRGRGHDWAAMPFVTVNEKDLLQHDLLAARGVTAPPVVHRVPTSDDFLGVRPPRPGLGAAARAPAAAGRGRRQPGPARVGGGRRPAPLDAVAAGLARAHPARRRRR